MLLDDRALTGFNAPESEVMAVRAEAAGLAGVWATESSTDPFLQSYAMLRATESITVGTGIAVAFARNPMSTAYSAWELAGMSGGRFVLGLGTQVRPHIERRFSMPWPPDPVQRMAEFVDALEAIWATWRTGKRLDFNGSFYKHDLMTPFFTPKLHEFAIDVYLAGLGERMMHLAGERCAGVILHPLMTVPYLDDVVLPAIESGLSAGGRNREHFTVALSTFMIVGDSERELESRREEVRRQIAFYASTPAYRRVLASIGYEDLQPELRRLSVAGRWGDMADLVDNELVRHFAVEGTAEEMPDLCQAKYGTRLDRTSSYFGWSFDDPERLRAVAEGFSQ